MRVSVQPCASYAETDIDRALASIRPLFAETIRSGDRVVLKPNWLSHRHKHRPDEWRSVVTNPEVITGVLRIVLECLGGSGEVVITDGPQTDSSWTRIMERMTPDRWVAMGRALGVPVSILDLRDNEWTTRGDVNIERRTLPGDPQGSTTADLGRASEFVGHVRSARGYYGADYNVAETNEVHTDDRHHYKVSRTVINADVFVNLPKMKTHKKAGVTCSLKNLVGINTYKNWLPHHTEGTPGEGGDQFPVDSSKRKVEGLLTDRFKAVLWSHPALGRWMVPVKFLGKKLFGDTRATIRSGNWYGNDTLWRTVLDLNKLLLYANPDGSLRPDRPSSRKRYISVVDGIMAGEGNGPEAPDPKPMGVIVAGASAVAVDSVCARLMGLDWQCIPSIRQAYRVSHYRLCDFTHDEIEIESSDPRWQGRLATLSRQATTPFRPHFGWTGHVELIERSDSMPLTLYQRFCERAVLPVSDLVLGQHVSARLRTLKAFQWAPTDVIERHRTDRLRALVRTCAERVPFYRDAFRAAGVTPEDIHGTADLPRLPILLRHHLREDAARLRLEGHVGRVYEMKSSGSTGMQTTALLDRACNDEVFATQLLFWSWGGFSMGRPHLQTGMSVNRGGVKRLKDFVFRCTYTSAFDLTDAKLETIAGQIERGDIRALFGYASSLYVIARFFDARGRQRPMDGIFTWGDSLFPHYRDLIERVFQCRVTDCYGLGEGLQCAAQCEEHDGLHEAMHGVVLEVVDRDGRPCADGELGRVLVTRLEPGPMPLVRYDTGDVAYFLGGSCPCGRQLRRLSRVQGRAADIVTTPAGDRMIVHFFTQIFELIPEIAQFQVRQEQPDAIRILYVEGQGFRQDHLEQVRRQILAESRFPLGIAFERVESIPLERSNKRRFVISQVPF